jgi:hypothetical protein
MDPLSELNALPLLAPDPPTRRQPRAKVRTTKRSGVTRDRRVAQRMAVAVECEERLGPTRYVRLTSDLSPFGLSTRQGYAHPVGTRLRLALYLPDQPRQPIHLKGEVVGVLGQSAGVRIAFRNPSGDAVRRIHHYLKSASR